MFRIQLVLKGGPERDTLLDIIQRSKSHHQKRAYQCMKCLTNLLSASTLAAEIFFEDADNKFRLFLSYHPHSFDCGCLVPFLVRDDPLFLELTFVRKWYNYFWAVVIVSYHYNFIRWEGAVNWLGVQLERRPGYHGNNPAGSWGNLSNETGNDFYIERSNSAVLVHQKVLFIIQVFP